MTSDAETATWLVALVLPQAVLVVVFGLACEAISAIADVSRGTP